MRRILQVSLTLVVALVVGASISADDQKEKKKKKVQTDKGRASAAVLKAFELPKEIVLSDEQQQKLATLKKEFAPKLEAANGKLSDVLTVEQRKARASAQKAAKDAGKKGKEAKADIDAAANLTEDQKSQMAKIQQEIQGLQREVRQGIFALLTDEQKAKLPRQDSPKKKKKKGNG